MRRSDRVATRGQVRRHPSPRLPAVIGHRGACGYRPEHTLASYELAARMGADFLEPDLVSTGDGVLVCRHEPELSASTDVAAHPEFASRRKTVAVDGVPVTGWFVEDFALAELRTLRAVEPRPALRQANTLFDRRFVIPTFSELLRLRDGLVSELGREIGLYPEIKHPTYFRQQGLDLEPRLIEQLQNTGMNSGDAPVFIQSFEPTSLRRLRDMGLQARLVQLVGPGTPFDTIAAGRGPLYADLLSARGLRLVAGYADALGADKRLVIPESPSGGLGSSTVLVEDAHDVGLLVHAYTFRAENAFLPGSLRRTARDADFGAAVDQQLAYLRAGVDGLFTDQPDITSFAREQFLDESRALRGTGRRPGVPS